MKCRAIMLISATAFFANQVGAYAQSTTPLTDKEPILNEALKASTVCEPLDLDAKLVAEALGYDTSKIPGGIDTAARWDKNFHTVKPGTLTIDPNRKIKAELAINCQPSDQGEIIKLIGKSPDELALKENAACEATVGANGEVPDLKCTVSGAVGDFLAKITDMNERLKPAFQKALTGI